MKKSIIFGLILTLVVGFFAFDINQFFTLESLKSSHNQLEDWLVDSPLLATFSFFIIYVLVTALSLPGATIMTLGIGALFGLFWGFVLVSFASTIGATVAFLAARYLLKDKVQKQFGQRLQAINQGIEKEGAFYLFTLRLVPVFPFFLVNLLMGLTPIKPRTYYWVSQLGMLPGTLVYVNAGTQLGQLESLSGILSFNLIASFALLGVFPLIANKLLAQIKKRRVYKRFRKPSQFDRNMIVIGGGAAGLVSAYIAAAVKAKVTLVEANKMGGDCLNYGCVPSKALIKSAKVAEQMRHADQYGLNAVKPSFSFKAVMQRIHTIIAAIEPHDSVERYTGLGVEVLQGYAKLIDPWTVEIQLNAGGTQRLTARSIVIAAGAKPVVPSIEGLEQVGYLTSDTLWETLAKEDEIPKRMVLLGGGPIGCELAQSFARLGSDVIQVERNNRVMMREDPEVSALAAQALRKSGVRLMTGYEAIRCEQLEDKGTVEKRLIVKNAAGEEEVILFDRLICAVGRTARLTGYGLEELGIQTERTVITNDYLETLYPNIYAAGDVAGPYQFTHTAAHQAWYAAVNALFGEWKKFKADYSVIPWTTFIDPEVARVGLSETEARERGIAFEVTRYGIDDLDRAITDSSNEGFVKVLTVPGKDKILGVTIVGTHAGDLLAEYVLAMKHGLGLNKILGTIHTYPTLAEANKFAAGEWKKAHAPQKLLAWVEKYHRWKRG
ncbi:Pyruvate/2-oxoglutarate dehydrogenase complex, dihydrolipoamide dehydrogenase (E3) component [Oceanospirillum multiglobuliferum]|uniref:Pyridine nucleotide-disulfide oxidoreductase n=1 Tax=Oceanospirillum multiglobuliferum TaxID=64969 RepID=A0A1T4L6V1_9GAMM|nr:bifunctional TVP38/TMEM64 family protein/FAD-dependent oxidoreductase [Oceanospirillum multiglobuliferum]OPX56776.1 pyridine nucleotide-disulfide oxidoreductase [Oceanospirillum multiglobuliferum]SJZ50338.1 Pyruvate/2-oxoglutarate dehydrogenase complex, dihydrolipoamide dehydrogenase (E3) component [Oceanospirillum multiglobuliferum]